MKYCQYNDALVAFTEVDAIREASSDGFAHVAVQHGELFGCAGDALNQELDFRHEFHSEPGRSFSYQSPASSNSVRACLRKMTGRIIAASVLELRL